MIIAHNFFGGEMLKVAVRIFYFYKKVKVWILKSEYLNSGYRIFPDGTIYMLFDGNEVNAVWNKGDWHFHDNGLFDKIPDYYDMEDLRQNEVIYRPI